VGFEGLFCQIQVYVPSDDTGSSSSGSDDGGNEMPPSTTEDDVPTLIATATRDTSTELLPTLSTVENTDPQTSEDSGTIIDYHDNAGVWVAVLTSLAVLLCTVTLIGATVYYRMKKARNMMVKEEHQMSNMQHKQTTHFQKFENEPEIVVIAAEAERNP